MMRVSRFEQDQTPRTPASSAALVAPVSWHRVLFRKHEKDVLVKTADLLAKAGLAARALLR